ncbi:RNA polymerase factor sigma-54 [Prosthecodimorpha staleyi]|uniref:RNA polymerase sigma-54 factor n=1 Tax=Prosthecodimorpha staleyi TaxID=2840188 RepID=A0A947GC24_9HYPH|nr:RNA polymerase factor sigma-54 [Prosthecodimorpha staleyi]MBT9290913.1 RNA polymerase factor sigma-54 [Prosthecodimorpha staleyi]
MALSAKLELRQSQSLVMTPQLMQAIKLLQLGSLDLVAYVEAELERNPLLDRDEGEERRADREAPDGGGAAEAGTAPEAPAGPDGPGSGDGEPSADWAEPSFETATAMSERLDTDMTNVFPDDAAGGERPLDPGLMVGDSWAGSGARSGPGGDDEYNLEAFVAAETSLADHLAEQLALAVTDPVRRLIGHYLIDAVDEAGYLRTDLDSVAEKLGCPVALVEEVLAVLQGFDPSGVCARDLRECLAIQLRERDRYDPAMRKLIENIELLARRDFAQLRKLCAVDDEDLVEMIGEIKALDPKPGNRFGSAPVQPVVPDVIVRAGPDGGWLIELNTETLPRVLVNQTYYATVAKGAKGEKDKQYLSDCLQSANWLVKSLDQRAKTIIKVASEIVRQQDAFLAYGVQHLRPLNLRMIADAIGMHESTVSRVTSNKYMATSRGIFEFKYFFTSSIASSEGGEAHSSESVRHRIKDMIDAEAPNDILSDDTIVKLLREAGIDIARRTVAKYREAMNIPSSVQRRREKSLG